MRYAILSDVHGNLPALMTVLADLEPHADALIYLGDAVGYYADSPAVIELLQARLTAHWGADALPWVAGNHEWGLLGWLSDRHFSPAALAALQRTRADMPAYAATFLSTLPERMVLELGDGLAATLVHASPSDPVGISGAGYIENGEDAREAAQQFTTQVCLVGHTHYPRICYEASARAHGQPTWEMAEVFEDLLPGSALAFGDQRVVLNPGSVGQPRDGDPRAAYALLDTQARTFSIRRVPYDIARTQARARAWLADAPPAMLDGHGGLAERLERGI